MKKTIIKIPTKPKEVRECISATYNTAGDISIPKKKDVQRWVVYPEGKSLGAKVFLEDGHGFRFRESRVINLIGRQEFTPENSVNASKYDFDNRREVVSEDGLLIIRKINKNDTFNNDLESIDDVKNLKDNKQDNPNGVLRSVLRKNTNGDPKGASISKGNLNGASIANDYPNGISNTNGNPSGARITNGNPSGASSTIGNLNGASIANDYPNGISNTNGNPSGTNIRNGNLNGASIANDYPNGISNTKGNPSGTNITNGNPNGSIGKNDDPNGVSDIASTVSSRLRSSRTLDNTSPPMLKKKATKLTREELEIEHALQLSRYEAELAEIKQTMALLINNNSKINIDNTNTPTTPNPTVNSYVHTTAIEIINNWETKTRHKFRDQILKNKGHHIHLDRYEFISKEALRELDTYFRNDAREEKRNHRELSNADFFEELEYIKANHDRGTIVPLEISASEVQFKFSESMDCINNYIQSIATIIENCGCGSLENYIPLVKSERELIKLLIKSFYNKEKYNGDEKYRATTLELYTQLQIEKKYFSDTS